MQQLGRAEAINDLNSFVLSDAAPSGKPFTVSELLGRAERIVQRQHGQAGSSRVELLTSIGVQYWAQDQDNSAARVLEEAYRLSLEIPEPATRARASCALAIALARGREPARAEALIKEGLRQLSDQSQFILDRVFCLERGSEVALTQGAAQQAIERAHQARELLTKSPFQSDVLQLDALMQEAEAYRVAGQFEKSSNAYEQASGLLTGLGRDETQAAIVVLNNWGLAKQFLGRTLDAENLFRRAIAISTTNSAEESVSPMLLVNYSRVLRELGRLVEAAGYAERAYDKAQRAGDQMVLNQSLFVRASIYRQAGDLARSAEMVSELEPRLRRSLPAGHLAFASLGMEQAAIAQSRGDLESAFAQVSRAVAMADASIQAGGGDGADYIPTLLLRRSTLELDMGRTDEAASDAARALQLVRRNASPGAFSSRVGLALLAVARARKAQGNRDEARAASHSAIEHLETTLGAAHPDVRAARQLAADLDSGRP